MPVSHPARCAPFVVAVVLAAGCGPPPTGLGPFAATRALDISTDDVILGDLRNPVTECRTPPGALMCLGNPFLWVRSETVYLADLGGGWSYAPALGVTGNPVGASLSASGTQHAAYWRRDGVAVDLGTLGGSWAMAVKQNAKGQTLIKGENANGVVTGAVSQGGVTVPLPSLGGELVEPYDLNDDGIVVGRAEAPDGSLRAVSWDTESGEARDLSQMVGLSLSSSIATAVTTSGAVAGTVVLANGNSYAVRWDAGGATILGTLGNATALFIADNDLVVGYVTDSSGQRQLVTWHPDQVVLTSPEAMPLRFDDANRAGTVVASATAGGITQGFVWDDGLLTRLPTLGGRSAHGYGVNRQGVVVGESNIAAGDLRAFEARGNTIVMIGPR